MQTDKFKSLSQSGSEAPGKRFAATIGTFDGVHRGHLCVLDTLRDAAAERGLSPIAITFDSHPLCVIAPERVPGAIMSTRSKLAAITAEGVIPQILHFTPSTARQSTYEWMHYLHDSMNVDCIIIGYDNTFGHDGRSLSPDDYIRMGKEIGIDVIVAPQIPGISSSAIRRAIAEGRIEDANNMLSAPFSIDGKVVEGDKIGRTIGVPTANLLPSSPEERAIPPFGVYATETLLPDGRILPSVTNIGVRPSIKGSNSKTPTIETHILNFNEDLYGKDITVRFLRFMRPEQKFPSLDALKAQLLKDIDLRL